MLCQHPEPEHTATDKYACKQRQAAADEGRPECDSKTPRCNIRTRTHRNRDTRVQTATSSSSYRYAEWNATKLEYTTTEQNANTLQWTHAHSNSDKQQQRVCGVQRDRTRTHGNGYTHTYKQRQATATAARGGAVGCPRLLLQWCQILAYTQSSSVCCSGNNDKVLVLFNFTINRLARAGPARCSLRAKSSKRSLMHGWRCRRPPLPWGTSLSLWGV